MAASVRELRHPGFDVLSDLGRLSGFCSLRTVPARTEPAKIASKTAAGIRFVEGDAEALPFADGESDAVLPGELRLRRREIEPGGSGGLLEFAERGALATLPSKMA